MGNVKTEGDWHHIEDAVYILDGECQDRGRLAPH